MIDEIRHLTDSYYTWLRDNTDLQAIDDFIEITTPFLDRHNDHMQIYAEATTGGYLLSDDGYTIADLEMCGCNLDSPKRQALLQTTLNGFGVRNTNDELQVTATPDDFAQKKHNLLQAMLAVNDLFYLASSTVASFFYEDVVAWLDAAEIRYSPRIKLTGKSGYDHHYDFVIPKSNKQPERVLMTINNPDRNAFQRVGWLWQDTQQTRPVDSHAFALLNDTQQVVSGNVITAFQNYGVRPVPWSERESVREELAA
ncbi:MAG: DUF1828 domain-containing protein [Chloroflexi bacterium]|nr:DUF1828 domain-containing protein [Chloroflexota bacterium]